MVSLGAHPPARWRLPAGDLQVVSHNLGNPTQRPDVLGDESEPVALLYPEFAHFPEDRGPLSAGGQGGEHRNLVDQCGDLLRTDHRRAERARPRDQGRHRLAELQLDSFHQDRRPHARQHLEKADPGRVNADAGDLEPASLGEHGRPYGERRRGGIPGNLHVERNELAGGLELNPAILLLHPKTEGTEQALGVVPGAAMRFPHGQPIPRPPSRPAAERS